MSCVHLDGSFQSLVAYLRQVAGHHAPHQPCKEHLLLALGRTFEPAALMSAERLLLERYAAILGKPLDGFEPKQCFFNSQQLVTAGPDGPLRYSEGYCYSKGGIPVHHAWLNLNGKVVDVTLRDRRTREPILGTFADRHYFGISFSTMLVRGQMLRAMSADPLLEDVTALDMEDGAVTRIVRSGDG